MTDKRKYRIIRWVDNNVVTMVSNVHYGNEIVQQDRKRPRQTSTNRTHLQTVWGTEAVRKITIPKVIDDYNHWMLGVDKIDQLIAYYRPNLRCRRTWMPMFFHGLDVVRVNSYIACRELGWKSHKRTDANKQHKEYLQEFIQALITKGKTMEVQAIRAHLLVA